MRKLIFSILCLWSTCFGQVCAPLDLDSAWQRVVSNNPALAASNTEIEMRQANKLQESASPNPIFGVEAENLGVPNDVNQDEVEPPQTTFEIFQTFELGGKKRARRNFAEAQVGEAYYDTMIERQNLFLELQNHFIEVSAAYEKLNLAKRREQIAKETLDIVGRQIDAGKVSPIQGKKAAITLKSAQIAFESALSELKQAKIALSSMWGSQCPDFDGVIFDLFSYQSPPSECLATEGIINTFDFAKVDQQIFSAGQNLALQKANRIPDVTLNFGYRIYNETNEHGYVVGLTMPIPVFNKNRGNIEKAHLGIIQAEQQMSETVRSLTEKVMVTHQKLMQAYLQADMYNTGIVTDAIETFNLTQIGYENGKLDYLDLLDSQRTLFEVQEKYIDVLSTYHLNKVELERMTRGL